METVKVMSIDITNRPTKLNMAKIKQEFHDDNCTKLISSIVQPSTLHCVFCEQAFPSREAVAAHYLNCSSRIKINVAKLVDEVRPPTHDSDKNAFLGGIGLVSKERAENIIRQRNTGSRDIPNVIVIDSSSDSEDNDTENEDEASSCKLSRKLYQANAASPVQEQRSRIDTTTNRVPCVLRIFKSPGKSSYSSRLCMEETAGPSNQTVKDNAMSLKKTDVSTKADSYEKRKADKKMKGNLKLLKIPLTSPLGERLSSQLAEGLPFGIRFARRQQEQSAMWYDSFCKSGTGKQNVVCGKEKLIVRNLRCRRLENTRYERHVHKYKFNRREREEFLRILKTGLNDRSRKLLARMKACSVTVYKLPDDIVSMLESSRLVPNATCLASDDKVPDVPEQALGTNNVTDFVDLSVVAANDSTLNDKITERESISDKMVNIKTSTESVASSSLQTMNSSDNNQTRCSKRMREDDSTENQSNPSKKLSKHFVNTQSLSFSCGMCSKIISCNTNSLSIIRSHYNDHGVYNIEVREERRKDGKVVLNIVEVDEKDSCASTKDITRNTEKSSTNTLNDRSARVCRSGKSINDCTPGTSSATIETAKCHDSQHKKSDCMSKDSSKVEELSRDIPTSHFKNIHSSITEKSVYIPSQLANSSLHIYSLFKSSDCISSHTAVDQEISFRNYSDRSFLISNVRSLAEDQATRQLSSSAKDLLSVISNSSLAPVLVERLKQVFQKQNSEEKEHCDEIERVAGEYDKNSNVCDRSREMINRNSNLKSNSANDNISASLNSASPDLVSVSNKSLNNNNRHTQEITSNSQADKKNKNNATVTSKPDCVDDDDDVIIILDDPAEETQYMVTSNTTNTAVTSRNDYNSLTTSCSNLSPLVSRVSQTLSSRNSVSTVGSHFDTVSTSCNRGSNVMTSKQATLVNTRLNTSSKVSNASTILEKTQQPTAHPLPNSSMDSFTEDLYIWIPLDSVTSTNALTKDKQQQSYVVSNQSGNQPHLANSLQIVPEPELVHRLSSGRLQYSRPDAIPQSFQDSHIQTSADIHSAVSAHAAVDTRVLQGMNDLLKQITSNQYSRSLLTSQPFSQTGTTANIRFSPPNFDVIEID